MSDHNYTVASFGANQIDVQYIRELIVAETPSIATDESEIDVYMEHIAHPGDVYCTFVPTLTAPQIVQLDAIMSGYTGRPALSPPNRIWIDEDHTQYSTTSTHPTYASAQLNNVTLDKGRYLIIWEATGKMSTTDCMRIKFTLDGTQIPYQNPLYSSNDAAEDSQYSARTEVVVTERASYAVETLYCRTWAGGFTAYIKDLVQTIERITDDR